MDESQGQASADYGTGDFDEDRSQNRCSKCHRFCSQCKCKKKKNLNEKERPQQALERGLVISHGERYSSLCLAQILILHTVFCLSLLVGFVLVFIFVLYSSSFDSSLQDGAPHVPPTGDVLRLQAPSTRPS